MKIKEHSESERRKTSRSERRTMDTQHQSSFDKNMETDLWTDEEAEWTDPRSCLFPPIDARKTEDILYERQRTKEDQRCLLEELARIEQDLKDSIRIEEKRRQEQNQVRREENRILWRSLSYLSLNQRTAKPWVTSYYKNIPMHIYCLPINTAVRRHNRKKTKP